MLVFLHIVSIVNNLNIMQINAVIFNSFNNEYIKYCIIYFIFMNLNNTVSIINLYNNLFLKTIELS